MPLRDHAWRVVAALAVTQTVGYGVLYYAFAVFFVPMVEDLHTSRAAIAGAYTASVIMGAALAVPVGRWLDRRGGRGLMTAGSALGSVMLLAWSSVDSVLQLYLVQVGIGAASAMSLYEPAFAVTVALFPVERMRAALLAITVVAGFASSIFLPMAGLLTDRLGWRGALVVLAAVHAVLTIPLHGLVLRRAPARGRAAAAEGRPYAVFRDGHFWLYVVGFTAHVGAVSAFTVYLVAALTVRGHSATFAATVAGLIGVLSVAGRLVTTGLQRRRPVAAVVAGIFAVQAAAATALPFVAVTVLGAVLTVIGFGLGFGVATIARPALLADRYGTASYATIAGLQTVPLTLAKATAPLALAPLPDTWIFLAIALSCAVAAAALYLSRRPT